MIMKTTGPYASTILVLLLLLADVTAQDQSAIDSLRRIVEEADDDSVRISALLVLADL